MLTNEERKRASELSIKLWGRIEQAGEGPKVVLAAVAMLLAEATLAADVSPEAPLQLFEERYAKLYGMV